VVPAPAPDGGSPARQADDEALRGILLRSRDLGFLGPGPVDDHLRHALAYLPLLDGTSTAVDLGSGGGLPGLVLALLGGPDRRWRLVDANRRRCAFLRDAVAELGLADRVEVTEGRAEDVGRRPDVRGHADVVVARSFGAPAVVAECAAPLLTVGGRLVVSDPPDRAVEDRWPAQRLDDLGLSPAAPHRGAGAHLSVMTQVRPCPDRYPRRVGVPAKRPLF